MSCCGSCKKISPVGKLDGPAVSIKKSGSRILKSFVISTPDIYEQIIKEPKLRVWVGTWNMHGQGPPADLHLFIKRPVAWEMDPAVDYHILAISTQECERTIEKSVIYPSKELWEGALEEHLKDRYSLIQCETMAALHLAVFVLKEIKHLVSDVESEVVATGIGNVIGNKGAVGIGFNFADCGRFLFINSHLSAHQKKIKERNADFQRICRELNLKGAVPRDRENIDVTDRFEYTFWAGDLNYRVNGTRKMIDQLLAQDLKEVLLANDQLNIERAGGRVFEGFDEAAITFKPTYKFDTPKKRRFSQNSAASAATNDSDESGDDEDTGSQTPVDIDRQLSLGRKKSFKRKDSSLLASPIPENEILKSAPLTVTPGSIYDSGKKQRIPSWTDRILFKTHLNPITSISYSACMEIMTSDHKPVFGVFEIDFKWNELFQGAPQEKQRTTSQHCIIL